MHSLPSRKDLHCNRKYVPDRYIVAGENTDAAALALSTVTHGATLMAARTVLFEVDTMSFWA